MEEIMENQKDIEKSLSRRSPKTDSEDECDTLVIRPKISQQKKKYQFSIAKQAKNPLKQIKLKKLSKEKLPSLSKGNTLDSSLEEERKVHSNVTAKSESTKNPAESNNPRTNSQINVNFDSQKEKPQRLSPDRRDRSSRLSRSKERRNSSAGSSTRHVKRYSNSKVNEEDKSITPRKEKGSLKDKTLIKATRADLDNMYDIKLGAEKHVEMENAMIISGAEEIDRSKEMETVIDFLKSNKKPRFNLLALPREGSQSKNFISYSQKIVHFTSTSPTISWAPNPKSEDQPYYMSRDFYLAHANADQILLYRAIAESNHIKFEDAPEVINARSWYPKDGYLSNKPSKSKVRGREKRISLVDYDSGDDREESRKGRNRERGESSSLRIDGNSVKVKSKWDSDYEEGVSEPCFETTNKSLPQFKSKRKATSPSVHSQPEKKKEEPEELANEYEEFLKQVGSETPDNKDKLKINRSKYSSPPSRTKNDWDNDTSSSSCKKSEVVTSENKDGEAVNPNNSKKKNVTKKKLVSNTDSSSETSDSTSDSSTKDQKVQKKKKKNKQKKKKKFVKKTKVQTSSSENEVVDKKSKKGKDKKPNKAAKLLQELQFQKLAIAKKLSELDTATDKKSKKAIVKDLKVLEEQILKSSKLETLLLPKKKIKKKKKKLSSSSDSESDAETKKKKSKKDKKKTKRKKVAMDSSSDIDAKRVKKMKKNDNKKFDKVKKKKEKIEAILDEIKESCEKSKEMKRKRPAEEDIATVVQSKRKIQEDDISGWEDEDSKVKVASDSIKMVDSNIVSEESRVTSNDKTKMSLINNSTDMIVDESINEKPGNCDWEANSESELTSIHNDDTRIDDKLNETPKLNVDEKFEVRAFGSVTQKSPSPMLTKPAEPILDLYSPGNSDSDALEDDSSHAGPPIIPEDSISIPFYIPPVSEASNPVLPTTPQLDISISSSTGCVISLDDVYDPLAIDSDASEESIPKATPLPLPLGLDDIPLPEFSSVADILLPGETSSPKKLQNKIDEKNNSLPNTSEQKTTIKINRWDSVEKSIGDSLPIDISSLGTIPLLIPKLPTISFSNLPASKDISSLDKSSQSHATSFITVKKGNAKLQSTVASVFQSNSDDEDASLKFKSSATKLPIDMIGEIDITNLPIPKVPARVIEVQVPIVQEPKFQEVIEKINAKCEEKEKKNNAQDIDLKQYSDKNRPDSKEYDRGREDKRYEKDRSEKFKENVSYASDTYKRETNRKRSVSPRRRESRRSPERRRRSRSTERRRSRTPDRRRSRTPDRRRSRSPNRRFKRRSRSLDKRDNWRRRSPSPRRKQRSPSPKQRRRPPSPRRQRSRTKSRSYSPRGYRRSRSPVRRQKSPPGRSPARRPLSPTKRRSFSPALRSPVRRRSSSPSASRSRNTFVPAYGQPGSTEINPPLPTMPFPTPVEKVMPESIYTMSVDHRIMHEFGVKLDSPPPPPMAPMVPPPVEPPHFYYPSPPAFQVVPVPPFSASQGGVVQVGNIMEVVPSVHALPPPPPPPPPPKQQIVQVGNMLQVVPTTRATAVVAPTPITPDPVATLDANVLQNPLIKAIQAEREKMKKEKDGRRAEREARRRLRQAKREAKLMTVSEKLKNVERNEGLVLGQDVDDEELLLEAMEPPSPPRPVKVVTAGHLPPAGKSILVTPLFNEVKDSSAKKHVSFADGLKPGESSEGEEKKEAIPKILPKEKRFKKKVKKKVKVRIIRQVIQSDEEDELPAPSPPPGDPPPILYATFPFGGQVQYPVYQTSVTTTTTKTTLHISAPLPQ